MVIVTTSGSSSSSCLHVQILPWGKPIPQFLQHFNQIYPNCKRPSRQKVQNSNGVLSVTAYMENPNSISSFANKVLGSLPVVGLVARILSDEGGVGGDIIDFAEFRRRVGKKCTITDSRAFYEFQDRRGRVIYFLLVTYSHLAFSFLFLWSPWVVLLKKLCWPWVDICIKFSPTRIEFCFSYYRNSMFGIS